MLIRIWSRWGNSATTVMLVRAGDRDGGTAYARAALDALRPEQHRLLLSPPDE